jgi:thioredoxin-related protein
MKKITLLFAIIAILFSCNGISQTKINWSNINDTQKQVKKDGKKAKIYFIDCYTSWCGWCKRLDATTFQNDTIARLLNKYYYPVKFDAEGTEEVTINGTTYKNNNSRKGRGATHELASNVFQVRGYPSMVIRNSDFSAITMIPGYLEAPELQTILVYYAQGYSSKVSYEEFSKDYAAKYQNKAMKELFKK